MELAWVPGQNGKADSILIYGTTVDQSAPLDPNEDSQSRIDFLGSVGRVESYRDACLRQGQANCEAAGQGEGPEREARDEGPLRPGQLNSDSARVGILRRVESKLRTIEVGGHPTRLYDFGEGPPVVVLHGWGGRVESMAPPIACLEPKHRVVAVDLPGFGESPAPSGAWGTNDYARFVSTLLNDLGIERASFVGHSYGAKTSLYLAATEPNLVDKLVLVGSSGLRTPPSFQARMKRVGFQRRALRREGRRAGTEGA